MNRVFFGHCIDTLRDLAVQGVRAQTCVTSPPYWGLRDYGVPPVHWPAMEYVPMAGLPPVSVPAWDGCLGLEPDPLMFVGHLVAVFRAVREVLAEDGTCWVNFGDSYAGSWGAQGRQGKTGELAGRSACSQRQIACAAKTESGTGSLPKTPGLKNKDLIGIPWRVAFALQADGWYLRSDIIWAKPNPMPESVGDRPTKAHEYFFLLAKSERYYYDAESVKEPASHLGQNNGVGFGHGYDREFKGRTVTAKGNRKTFRGGSVYTQGRSFENDDQAGNESVGNAPNETGLRNKRTVWTVATKPYSGAHLATFPPELIEPCILAGSRPGDIVLDPFFGSGTTGEVAQRLGRQWIGCELQTAYEPLQRERTRQTGLCI